MKQENVSRLFRKIPQTTVLLLCLFLLSQIIGLYIIGQYIDVSNIAQEGDTSGQEAVINTEIYIIEPPKIENKSLGFIPIVFAVCIGTLLLLLLIKLKSIRVWKYWFMLSVVIALVFAWYPFILHIITKIMNLLPLHKMHIITNTSVNIAISVTLIVALIAAYMKIVKKNIAIHNITEICMYGGIVSLFIPILNIVSAIILLITISIYDAYAVWRSKHMIALAEFQKDTFAGLLLKKEEENRNAMNKKQVTQKHIINNSTQKQSKSESTSKSKKEFTMLGGGDMAFPLLFSGVIYATTGNFLAAVIISFGAAAGLVALFISAKQKAYYPAMPFITAGIFIGYAVALLLVI